MIKYLTRNQIDIIKYDNCISNAGNSQIYAYSWYLDIVCDDWAILVKDDYYVVMPLPKRKKYFINYVYTPFWVIQLGIFYNIQSENKKLTNDFLNVLKRLFKSIDLRLNTGNYFEDHGNKRLIEKNLHSLTLNKEYINIFSGYKKDRKKDLRKASKHELSEIWNDSAKKLIKLFKNNVGLRTPNIGEIDYKRLEELFEKCISKKVGETIGVYDENNALVASAFLLKNKNKVTILVSSTDFNNRNNGANTFLIDRVIEKYGNQDVVLDFGGSSIPSIASFFESFGAEKEKYHHYKKSLFF